MPEIKTPTKPWSLWKPWGGSSHHPLFLVVPGGPWWSLVVPGVYLLCSNLHHWYSCGCLSSVSVQISLMLRACGPLDSAPVTQETFPQLIITSFSTVIDYLSVSIHFLSLFSYSCTNCTLPFRHRWTLQGSEAFCLSTFVSYPCGWNDSLDWL